MDEGNGDAQGPFFNHVEGSLNNSSSLIIYEFSCGEAHAVLSNLPNLGAGSACLGGKHMRSQDPMS